MTAPLRSAPRVANPVARLDIRDLACPLTWVRTSVALGRIRPGEVLEVLLREGEPLENIPRTAAEEGHLILRLERAPGEGEGVWRAWLARRAREEEGRWP